MAVYKVPQDVEAEDKLIGPFSFRQFIYLGVAAGAIFVGFFLFQIFPGLIIIPLPIVLLFGALALPLRKDQPMETYLIALARFYLKPKRRMWNPDGTLTYVEITAPKVVEESLTKDFSQETAQERLDYLARIMDSRGWSLKGVTKANDSLNPTVTSEAENALDIMDDHADLAKSFDTLIAKKNQEHRQAAVQSMQQQAAAPQPSAAPRQPNSPQFARNPYSDLLQKQFANSSPAQDDTGQAAPHFNPYPTEIHQKVIRPYDVSQPAPQQTEPKKQPQTNASAMTATVSPDIIRLANNNDLSVSAIAHEAHRLEEGDEGEVIISLH